MGVFSFLTDPIQSLFTGAGSNAARKQQEGQQAIGNYGGQGAEASGQNWLNQLKFGQSFNPQMQQGLTQLGRNLSDQGRFQGAVHTGNMMRSNAMSQSTPLQYQQNPWMADAYRSNNLNKATDAGNQEIRKSQSQEAQAGAYESFMKALMQMQNAAYAPLGQAAGLVYGQPQAQVQPGFMEQISPALGAYLGGLNRK